MTQHFQRKVAALILLCAIAGCVAGPEEQNPNFAQGEQAISDIAVVASEDATIRQLLPFSNFGDDRKLAVHGASAGSYERALVKFSGAEIAKQLEGRELQSATLELNVTACGFTIGNPAIAVHRMTRTWSEAFVTWACRNETTPGNPFSIDCETADRWKMDPFPSGARPFVEAATDIESVAWWQTVPVRFDVTADVNFLLNDDAASDVSFMLRNTEELNGVWLDLGSREGTKPPVLKLKTRLKTPDELVSELEAATSQLVRTRYRQAAPGFDPNAAVRTTALVQRIERSAFALIDSMPPDLGLQWNSDLSPYIRRLGVSLNALMVAKVPFAIGHRPAGRCSNLIVARNLDDATDTGSFVSDYFRLIAIDDEPNAREALSALTGVQEGIRCLTLRDLSFLERGYVSALYEIVQRLRAKKSSLTAHAFWDRTLPLSFLFLDATKYFQFPLSLWAIRFPINPNQDLPRFSIGFNENIAIARSARNLLPWQDTLLRVFYCRQEPETNRFFDNEPRLRTLGRFGLWTEDVVHDGALTRLKLADRGLCKSLQYLTEIVRFGAGDCSLHEMSLTDFKCSSPGTCNFELLPGGGIRFRPGSPLTQFGTPRQGALDENCQDGETIPPAYTPNVICINPRRGGGFFSPDPEIDRFMRCALRTRRGGPLMTMLSLDQGNLLCRNVWARDGGGSGDSSGGSLPNKTGDVTDEEEVQKAIEEAAKKATAQAGAVGQAAVDQAGAGNASPGAAGAVAGAVKGAAEALRLGTIRVHFGGLPQSPGSHHVGNCCTRTASGLSVITVDRNALEASGANLADVLAHELTHEALFRATSATSTIFNDAGKENVRKGDHVIMGKGGVILCGDDGPCGNPDCMHQNAVSQRFEECLRGGGGNQPICPHAPVDIPCRRVLPPPSGCFAVQPEPGPTVCQAVLCGPNYQTSQGLIGLPEVSTGLSIDCCGSEGGPVPGGGDFCRLAPSCENCCHNCVCPAPGFSDPAVPVEPCIGCSFSVPGPD